MPDVVGMIIARNVLQGNAQRSFQARPAGLTARARRPASRAHDGQAAMKLVAALARSLQADMQVELRTIERAVTTGTRDAGRGLKTELRRQVGSVGLN
jgi:hypothetical protein